MKIQFSGKTSDMAGLRVRELDIDADGYFPYIDAVGGGDYFNITIDNDTGLVVGWVPLTEEQLREAADSM